MANREEAGLPFDRRLDSRGVFLQRNVDLWDAARGLKRAIAHIHRLQFAEPPPPDIEAFTAQAAFEHSSSFLSDSAAVATALFAEGYVRHALYVSESATLTAQKLMAANQLIWAALVADLLT